MNNQGQYEKISTNFRSNCAVQAIKAKLKNRTVKLYFCKPQIKNGKFQSFHFMWSDGIADYDFSDEDCYGHRPFWRYLWFDGFIRKFPLGFAKRFTEFRNRKAGTLP